MITPIVHEEATTDCRLSKNILSDEQISHNPIIYSFLKYNPHHTLISSYGESSPISGDLIFNGENSKLIVGTRGCVPFIYYLYSPSFKVPLLPETWFESSIYDTFSEKEIIEVIQDFFLIDTHEKWKNIHNNTVYVYPESTQKLLERGYIIEKKEFFDFQEFRFT